jgi:electron transfer flavoprotein beta subunit
MKIVVFIKQIVYVYARTGNSPDSHFITGHDRIYRINPYDEVAMQLAARTKKEHDRVSITAVILGPIIAKKELYRCLALGADEVLHIQEPEAFSLVQSPDALQKSKILANAVAPLGADVILCGKKSLDIGSGQVGAFTAHELGAGFISSVTGFSIDPASGTARARRNCGRGVKEIIECRLPAVFSVALIDGATDLPTWEKKQKIKSMKFTEIPANTGTTGPRVKRQKVFAPRPRPKAVPPLKTDAPSHDRVSQLLSPSLIKKKGVIKKGTPDELADSLFFFLKSNDFLPKDSDR